MSKLVKWALKRSVWVFHVNSGSCNGCDIEILAALTSRYDTERFGIKLVGSPRQADVLLMTGPITSKQIDRVERIYEQTADPKYVMVIGTCGTSGGVFDGCYNIEGGIDSHIPVDVYVMGCPAKPEEIFDGFVRLIKKIEEGAGLK